MSRTVVYRVFGGPSVAGVTGKYDSREEAAEAVRIALGWDTITLSAAYSRDDYLDGGNGEGTAQAVYQSEIDELDDPTHEYSPASIARITEIA